MKVLVVGGGGREHALVWKLSRSPRRPTIFCAPGNAGTNDLATNVHIQSGDIDGLFEIAKKERIDLTIVGPEEALCAGLVDRFEAAGLRAFGPRAAAARLEGDKGYAKQLMKAGDIPTADARVFAPTDQERAARLGSNFSGAGDVPTRVVRAFDRARDYVSTREGGLVVKASGLARGKGVFVCADNAEALTAIERLMVDRELGEAGESVVVEERLVGPELSVLAFVDGRSIYVMEPARDYKRLGDGDAGPNTGGMGAYCPVDDVTAEQMTMIEREVFVPIIDGLRREGVTYSGVLYAGLMLTPGGPKVLEFNCRFGDPEAQPLLVRLKTDLLDVIDATIDGRLDEITLEWDSRAAVCVVLAAPGYPDKPQVGATIDGLAEAAAVPDVHVFHAGTRNDGRRILTAGGRVLAITALGDTRAAALRRAYEAADRISFAGMQFRHDIAAAALEEPVRPTGS